MNTNSTRLEEIAERNSRSRIVDVAFAAMMTMLVLVYVLSLAAA